MARRTSAPRAQAILETAYQRIQDIAAKINDQALCQSFLENVSAHRAIIEAWTRSNLAPT